MKFIYCSQTAKPCHSNFCVENGICDLIHEGKCIADSDTLIQAREKNHALITPIKESNETILKLQTRVTELQLQLSKIDDSTWRCACGAANPSFITLPVTHCGKCEVRRAPVPETTSVDPDHRFIRPTLG